MVDGTLVETAVGLEDLTGGTTQLQNEVGQRTLNLVALKLMRALKGGADPAQGLWAGKGYRRCTLHLCLPGWLAGKAVL